MKKETAIQIINEALNIAIAKGCFGLVEVTNIVKAVEVITEQPPQRAMESINSPKTLVGASLALL